MANRGAEYYPYVRTLGGVSLFDFVGFDPEAYRAQYPMASWWTFVPTRRDWGASIWIEMDRCQLGERFVSGLQLLKRWNENRAHQHMIMPIIEAASLDPIPVSAFRRVLRFTSESSSPEVVSGA